MRRFAVCEVKPALLSGPCAPVSVCEGQSLPGDKTGHERGLVILGKNGLPLAGFKKVKPLKHVS